MTAEPSPSELSQAAWPGPPDARSLDSAAGRRDSCTLESAPPQPPAQPTPVNFSRRARSQITQEWFEKGRQGRSRLGKGDPGLSNNLTGKVNGKVALHVANLLSIPGTA